MIFDGFWMFDLFEVGHLLLSWDPARKIVYCSVLLLLFYHNFLYSLVTFSVLMLLNEH